MKSIFLYTESQLKANLCKINSHLYYDSQRDNFYRLNVMPKCTVFASEDVEEKQMMTLTSYDPIFYMIQMLYKTKKLNSSQIPEYLKKQDWSCISKQQSTPTGTFYSINRQKIYDYLQKKVDLLKKYIDENNPFSRIKIDNSELKTIPSDVVSLLKNQLTDDFVKDFVTDRYQNSSQIGRKITPSIEQDEVFKPKIQGKNNKKSGASKHPSIQKSQSTLIRFFQKK